MGCSEGLDDLRHDKDSEACGGTVDRFGGRGREVEWLQERIKEVG